MATLHERFELALAKLGYTVDKYTVRYTVMRGGTDKKYYIGLRGALRCGRTRATSVPVSDAFKNRLISMVQA